MDIFWILDPDPHNNRCGSATLQLAFQQVSLAILFNFQSTASPSAGISSYPLHLPVDSLAFSRYLELSFLSYRGQLAFQQIPVALAIICSFWKTAGLSAGVFNYKKHNIADPDPSKIIS